MNRINVTKSFLPPLEEYKDYLERIWKNDQLTNQGPLLLEFENVIKTRLQVDNFHFVSNGTLALQLALRAFDILDGEIITTPFSYVATTSAILWERCQPIFVDINPTNFCIDATKIEKAITKNTRAIMAVHVFGNPCDIEAIGQIAKKHNLKVIYDGAHAFGTNYNGRPLLSYGDISICSFHATKLFHTIEGGGIFVNDKKISNKIELLKRFGHNQDEYILVGINAKASEFQAAMGLINLKYIDDIIYQRREISNLYDELLHDNFKRPIINSDVVPNYAYYPILFPNEKSLHTTLTSLSKNNIFPRRYFHPSLNKLPYLTNAQDCPISEDIARRIVCLPLYPGLEESEVRKICEIINS